MKLLFENWRKYLKESNYVISEVDPISIKEVISNWVEGDKTYPEESHAVYPIEELLEYRNEVWSTGRPNKTSSELQEVMRDLKEVGITKPIVIYVGQNGQAKIAEGNEVLSMARQLNIKEAPVRFVFKDSVMKGNKTTAEPAVVGKTMRDLEDSDIEKGRDSRPGYGYR